MMQNGCENKKGVWEFRSKGRIRREKSERRENLEGRENKRREESKRRQHNIIMLIIQIIKVYIANSWGTIYRPQPKPKYQW